MTQDIPLFNITISQRLKKVAELLHSQGSNPFRVLAYQHATQILEQLERSIDDLVRTEGIEGLKKLPGVGESLARALRELVLRGRLPMLERLRGETEPENPLATIPGIGKKLAPLLHHDLEIDTLEELETAVHDGRLRKAGGIGEKRLAGLIACLTERLGRARAIQRKSLSVNVWRHGRCAPGHCLSWTRGTVFFGFFPGQRSGRTVAHRLRRTCGRIGRGRAHLKSIRARKRYYSYQGKNGFGR